MKVLEILEYSFLGIVISIMEFYLLTYLVENKNNTND